jgi:hypothetical protein
MDRDSRRRTMSYGHDVLVTGWGGDRSHEMGHSAVHNFAILEELRFVRAEAQAEADLAYEDWRCLRSEDTYAVYRAAQDRADAAQDDLARLTEQVTDEEIELTKLGHHRRQPSSA